MNVQAVNDLPKAQASLRDEYLGTIWGCASGTCPPGRAFTEEFAPAGRLMVGRPFTTCTTLDTAITRLHCTGLADQPVVVRRVDDHHAGKGTAASVQAVNDLPKAQSSLRDEFFDTVRGGDMGTRCGGIQVRAGGAMVPAAAHAPTWGVAGVALRFGCVESRQRLAIAPGAIRDADNPLPYSSGSSSHSSSVHAETAK